MTHRSIVLRGAAGNRLSGDLYEVASGAPVALLLHGGGQTRHAWRGTERRLAEHGITAVAFDQRGHGDSDRSPPYRFENFAEDLVVVADAIAQRFGRRPCLVGASLGGIAGMLAEGEAARPVLSGLVLVDVTPRMDPAGLAKVLGFMGARADEGFATIEEAADAIAAYPPERPRPKSLEGLKKNLRRGADGRWRWHWDPLLLDGFLADPRIADRLAAAVARLAVPTLLVRGSQSELVSEEHAREFLRLVPHAAYADVSGAGHMLAGDRNDVFTDAVVGFVAGLAAR